MNLRANFDTLLAKYPSGMYVNSSVGGEILWRKAESYVVVGNGAAELDQGCDGRTFG